MLKMVFEGVIALNLRPNDIAYDSVIYEASLFLEDAIVFFCDGETDGINEAYDGTWIKSMSLRWRFIKKHH